MSYVYKRISKLWAAIALLSIELIIVLILFGIAVLGFFYLVTRIVKLEKVEFDFAVFEWLQPYITPFSTNLMVFITFFATHKFLIPANLILIAYFLFIRKHRWYSIKVPVVAIGSVLSMLLLKLYFSRPRPMTPLLEEVKGFSFPSGHAMSSMTFYGLLIYLVYKHVKKVWLKWILILLLIATIVLIGFSRIYLRVHYTTDVLAGFSVGLIWLVLSLWLMSMIERYTRREIAPTVSANP